MTEKEIILNILTESGPLDVGSLVTFAKAYSGWINQYSVEQTLWDLEEKNLVQNDGTVRTVRN